MRWGVCVRVCVCVGGGGGGGGGMGVSGSLGQRKQSKPSTRIEPRYNKRNRNDVIFVFDDLCYKRSIFLFFYDAV